MQPSYDKPTASSVSRSLFSLALFSIILEAPKALAAQPTAGPLITEFDTQAIQASGIDPSLAELFRYAPRFLPGKNTVALTVNGSSRAKVMARFDADGQLCGDQDFLKQAGLLTPPGFSTKAACFDLTTAWPQTELNLDPAQGRVDLVLPAHAVSLQGADTGNWSHGGTAGMLNYDAQYMDSAGTIGGVQFMQVGSEAGLNISDWIIRSRQIFSRLDGEDRLQHQSAYAQRTFMGSRQVLQTGQITLSNSMFGTGQVRGFQLFPESALQRNRGGPALVEGVADNQSVVEVRQSGVLVHSTTVPAGPFSLQHFQLLNTRSDLHVTLTRSDGGKRTFVVPASTLLLNGNGVAPGFSFGVGKLEQAGSSASPLISTVASGWRLSPRTTLNAGLLGSTPYRAGAIGVDSQPFDATTLSVQGTVSQDIIHDLKGASLTASLTHKLSERISISINASQQTAAFRGLSDAIQEDDFDTAVQRSFRQVGTGLSWSTASFGSLSLSVARSAGFDGGTTHYMRGGWSKQFGQVSVGASLEQDTGSSTSQADSRFYLTVNVPIGSRSVSSYINTSNKSGRGGVRYSDRSSNQLGWNLWSEQDFQNQRTFTGLSMDSLTPLSQLSASLSRDSNDSTTWAARASGGAVLHDNGLALSPHRVGDTFGIARIGDEGRVKLDTPSGPTWTNSKGYAVLPTLSTYKRSSVQVDTRSLAKNVDIANAFHETNAARGSVSYVDFAVVRTRRVLVEVTDRLGETLPHGASLFDSAGAFVAVAGERGSVFLSDAHHGAELTVQVSGRTLCTFSLSLPEKAETNALYETSHAQCH